MRFEAVAAKGSRERRCSFDARFKQIKGMHSCTMYRTKGCQRGFSFDMKGLHHKHALAGVPARVLPRRLSPHANGVRPSYIAFPLCAGRDPSGGSSGNEELTAAAISGFEAVRGSVCMST
jgi:hypothetical protein